MYGLSLNGWHALFCITNNRHDVTITTHAIKRHFLIWMATVRQPTKCNCSCVLTLKCNFICVYWWTRQRIRNILLMVDRYLRLMGDKTVPDSAEPRLESVYPPWVAGINLPHQGVVDSYNLNQWWQFHWRIYTSLGLNKLRVKIYSRWWGLHQSTKFWFEFPLSILLSRKSEQLFFMTNICRTMTPEVNVICWLGWRWGHHGSAWNHQTQSWIQFVAYLKVLLPLSKPGRI